MALCERERPERQATRLITSEGDSSIAVATLDPPSVRPNEEGGGGGERCIKSVNMLLLLLELHPMTTSSAAMDTVAMATVAMATSGGGGGGLTNAPQYLSQAALRVREAVPVHTQSVDGRLEIHITTLLAGPPSSSSSSVPHPAREGGRAVDSDGGLGHA